MSGLICPKCGKKSEDIEFIDAFCINCYPVNITVPRKIGIEQCKRCGKIRLSGEWQNFSEKRISDYVISRCKGDFDSAEYLPDEGKVRFTIKGKKQVKRSIEIEFKQVICANCSRMSGGYFQGVIQLRGDPKKVEKYARIFNEKLGKRTFITKEEDKHGGVDIYVGNSKAVVELLTEMKIKSLMTRKLSGVEEGKRVYRVTFLLRFD